MISNFRFQIPNQGKLLFTFAFLLFALSCSMPNLESPECTDSRLAVKQFYSFHFANEMKFSEDNLKQREKFLTPEFAKSLQNSTGENDVFTTNSSDLPKAFRIGECKVIEPTKTNLEIVLFWKDDNRSEQKPIQVEAVKQADKWLLNKILY
jgi:hypothetical protein